MLPLLAFEPGPVGAQLYRRDFQHRIGGLSPSYIEEAFAYIKPDAMVNDTPGTAFQEATKSLTNHGQGTAFDVSVQWSAIQVNLKSDSFTVDPTKRLEPKYDNAPRGVNSMPAIPSHIPPGGKAGLPRIPVFMTLDPDKQIKSVKGEVYITYRDAFGESWRTVQEVTLFARYDEEEPFIQCNYGDISELPTAQ